MYTYIIAEGMEEKREIFVYHMFVVSGSRTISKVHVQYNRNTNIYAVCHTANSQSLFPMYPFLSKDEQQQYSGEFKLNCTSVNPNFTFSIMYEVLNHCSRRTRRLIRVSTVYK